MIYSKERRKTVEFVLPKICNYNCSYCTSGPHTIATQYTLKRTDSVVKFLKSLNGRYEIIFTTGEPLIVKNLGSFIKSIIKETTHLYALTSNLSQGTDKIISLLDPICSRLKWFNASMHLEYVQPERFFKKCRIINDFLKEKKVGFSVVSVALKDKLIDLEKIGDRFIKKGINFYLQPQKIFCADYVEYTPRELKIIYKYGKFYDLSNYHFRGKTCYSGIDYFTLHYNGDVFRCFSSARIGKTDLGYLGNIYKGNIKKWHKPRLCRYEMCRNANPRNRYMILNKDKIK